MSEDPKRPPAVRQQETPPEEGQHADDEGADGLGYTARPTDHEPEGDKAPAGGGRDATRK
jgi:hypothetical protein